MIQDDNPRIGVFAGTFDPITKGHLDIISRSIEFVDQLYVAVAVNSSKDSLFSASERKEMIENELKDLAIDSSKIKVEICDGLLAEFAKVKGANIAIRGIRSSVDFEYELQMSRMNNVLNPNLQTIFLPATFELQLVSSKLVKEVVRLNGKIDNFISTAVFNQLRQKFNN